MSPILFLVVPVVLLLAYVGAPILLWTLVIGGGLVWLQIDGGLSIGALQIFWAAFAAFALVGNLPPLRRLLFTGPVFRVYRRILPQVSQTEQEALDAGTVWWDGDLFSGKPDYQRLHAIPAPKLSAEEQAFLDGPVNQLCSMLDDWQITHELKDLPPNVWQYIKDQGFLGMIIPKKYGGLGFSALAHSTVVMKISSRSATAGVTVMVPNSLGPAELLLHYGTDAQKDHFLPRLAKGLDIPCFALTGPDAGSDAGAIPDFGLVCRGMHDGQEVLGIRLTWEKRYITLGPVATILGMAFKLYDPEHLLGAQDDLGITLALIPTNHPGVNIGRRHFPLNGVFQNGPNWGKDVFIPLDWVIGGRERVGQGWRMLMNCLAAGRSISLPAQSTGAGKFASFATGAYARVRSQFKMPIGKFEGIEEALARIGGHTYTMEAARVMTAGAVDLGEKPSVLSAVIKYHATERMRQVINDAMDVHGGKGICLGPRNYLGRTYQIVPVGITVEGANILTRSMMIFGQGAIRCHPYVLKEIAAAQTADLPAFDQAFTGHLGFIVRNAARSLVLGLTGARLAATPGGPLARYYQQVSRASASFALMADMAMFTLGGSLKRREKLSARLGDVLSHLYLATAVLKKFKDDGEPAADLALARWSLEDSLYRIQDAFDGLLRNFPLARGVLRILVFPLGKPLQPPSDHLGHEVARLLIEPNAARSRLIAGLYVPDDETDIVGVLEAAMRAVIAAEPLEAKLRQAEKAGQTRGRTAAEQLDAAQAAGVVNADERLVLDRARRLRRAVIMVDDFPKDFGSEAAADSAAVIELRKRA